MRDGRGGTGVVREGWGSRKRVGGQLKIIATGVVMVRISPSRVKPVK